MLCTFIAYILINNFFFSISAFIYGKFKLENFFLFLKGNLCLNRDPDLNTGSLFLFYLILKLLPAVYLAFFYARKRKSIDQLNEYIIISYYLYDIYSIASFLLIQNSNFVLWSYGFSSVNLFVASKVIYNNYFLVPTFTSAIGICLFLLSKNIRIFGKLKYLLLLLVSIFLSILVFEVLIFILN